MNKNKEIKELIKDNVYFLILFSCILIFLWTNSNLFYLDTPWAVVLSKTHKFTDYFFHPIDRFMPMMDFLYIITNKLFGNIVPHFFVIQAVILLITILLHSKMLKKIDDRFSKLAYLLLISSGCAENLFTIGKMEIVVCFCMCIYTICTYKYLYENGSKSNCVCIATFFLIGLITKETAAIMIAAPCIIFVFSILRKQKEKVYKTLSIIIIDAIILGIIELYTLYWRTSAPTSLANMSIDLFISNIKYYFSNCTDIFILGIVGLFSNIICFLKNNTQNAEWLASLNLSGWGYIAAMSLWRWPCVYYMLPAMFFMLPSCICFFQLLTDKCHKIIRIALQAAFIILIAFMCNNFIQVGIAQTDSSTVYTQAMNYIADNLEDDTRIAYPQFSDWLEPVYESENVMSLHNRKIEFFGANTTLLSGSIDANTRQIYNLKDDDIYNEKYVIKPGDYVLILENVQDFYVDVRCVNPGGTVKSYYINLLKEKGYELELISETSIIRRHIKIFGNHDSNAGYSLYLVK